MCISTLDKLKEMIGLGNEINSSGKSGEVSPGHNAIMVYRALSTGL